MHNNKPWYVLIYGNYASPQAAKAALDQLPKNLKQLKPWVRPLSSVQSAIKHAG
ncbi:MAG: SPOR domain-containing protein [Coxiellaceae bacterium]|nr:MAG: SPOR domain-containing protein [Coxiellaceae bacterium]